MIDHNIIFYYENSYYYYFYYSLNYMLFQLYFLKDENSNKQTIFTHQIIIMNYYENCNEHKGEGLANFFDH